MAQLDTQAKEAMFTKERMTGEASAKSQKLNHLAQERIRLLNEVERLTSERDTLLKNRENYDSQEHDLRSQISMREQAANQLKMHCDQLTNELSQMSMMDRVADERLSAKRRVDAIRSSNIKSVANSAKSLVERNLHHRYDVPVMPRHFNIDSAIKPDTVISGSTNLGVGIIHAT